MFSTKQQKCSKNSIISSPFFTRDSYLKYLRSTYTENSENLKSIYSSIFKNNEALLRSSDVEKQVLIYGDVQSGKTNNLIYIAHNLCRKEGFNCILYLSGSMNSIMFQNKDRFCRAFEIINKNVYINTDTKGTNSKDIDFFQECITNERIPIVHSLKRVEALNKLGKTLLAFKDKINLLIIDDEGDDTSLAETTQKSITRFLGFRKVKLISISATPFLNLYKNSIDYDNFYKLKPPNNYFGVEYFHTNHVVKLQQEKNFILRPLLEWLILSTNRKDQSQILFNCFNSKEKHNSIKNLIDEAIRQMFSKTNVEGYLNELNLQANPQKISEVCRTLVGRVSVDNSENTQDINTFYPIVIGGIKLSRGITYERLTHMVMLNMGEKVNAGTLVQRARWCGYRSSSIKDINIYMTENIYNSYSEVIDLIGWTKKYCIGNKNYQELFRSKKYKWITIN